MRLLYLIDSLAPGGTEQSLAELAPHYAARGIDLEVCYLHDRPGLDGHLKRAGADLFPLTNGNNRIAWTLQARRLITQRRPDLIHTALFDADQVGRIAGALTSVPVVSSLVNAPYGSEHLSDPHVSYWKVRAAQLTDMITARRVRRFHAVTRHVAEVMSRRLRIRRDRIETIPRGRSLERLGIPSPGRRIRARQALGLQDSTPVVLAVGRQEYQKGFDVLLRAFPVVLQKHPRAELFVAGRDGSETVRLRQLRSALRLDDSVHFLGVRHDVPELFCAADMLAFPSRREGLPGVVLEAMALEVPLVATDLPPIREVLGEGGEWVVPPEDPEALGAAIVRGLLRTDLSAERAKRARTRFLSRFTIERVADRMMAFYRRALQNG